MLDGAGDGFAPPHIPAAASGAGGTSLVLTQTSRNIPFLKLSLRLGLLNLLTLTMYRFWGRTTVRQQLWRDTTLNGEPFEYTGTGFELFKGFLIALVTFTLPYLLIVFLSQMLPLEIGLPLFLAVLLISLWGFGAAIWLAFRFNASRTTWRAVRFELIGSVVDYAWMYFRYQATNILLLGWWTVRMDLEAAQRLWGELFYGSQRIEFNSAEAKCEPIYRFFTLGWVGAIGAVALAMQSADWIVGLVWVAGTDATEIESLVEFYIAAAVWFFLTTLAFAPYQAALLRAVTRAISISHATFGSSVRASQILWLSASNLLLVSVSLGFLSPLAQARSFRLVINSITSSGLVKLDTITQAERGPDQAEGLADTLDLGFM